MTNKENSFLDEVAMLCVDYGLSYSDMKDLIHYNKELFEFKLSEGEFTGESDD